MGEIQNIYKLINKITTTIMEFQKTGFHLNALHEILNDSLSEILQNK